MEFGVYKCRFGKFSYMGFRLIGFIGLGLGLGDQVYRVWSLGFRFSQAAYRFSSGVWAYRVYKA